MLKKILPALVILCVLSSYRVAEKPAHFVKPLYTDLPLGAIRPTGWLRETNWKIMRDGTTGHLDEVYAKVKNDNGWLGGKGDGWEETPYWLDGAVPLAYLLDEATLKAKVLKYLNWTIDHQRPSGYFGPITKAERDSGATITTCHRLPQKAKTGGPKW